MKRVLKVIGLLLLLFTMAYMTRYDVPNDIYVVINGEKVYGRCVDGMWYEPLEVYGGSIPDEFFEGEN